ncbi:Sodium/potassium/calcium exchanger 3, partial [Fragariocoptes setiger]
MRTHRSLVAKRHAIARAELTAAGSKPPRVVQFDATSDREARHHHSASRHLSGTAMISTVAAVLVWLVVAGYVITASMGATIVIDSVTQSMIHSRRQENVNLQDVENSMPGSVQSSIVQSVEPRTRRGTQFRTVKKVRLTTTTTTTTTTSTTTPVRPNEASDDQVNDDTAVVPAEPNEGGGDESAGPQIAESDEGDGAIIEPETDDSGDIRNEPEPSKLSPKKTSTESNILTTATPKRARLVQLPFIKAKNESVCVSPAYLEFPPDPIGSKWRGRGFIIIHVALVVYMFYALALVCERYFIPSLEEFAQRLNLSEDVAGATLMSAGSSAPELFTAILGVFIAKGDVGTGAIVGSAATIARLNWWPILRDSLYYTFTVLVLILFIYDERVTAFESLAMLALYGLYIVVMYYNEQLKDYVIINVLPNLGSLGASMLDAQANEASQSKSNDDVFCSSASASGRPREIDFGMFRAALLVIQRHKRLFSTKLRFQSAARLIIYDRQRARNTAATTSVSLVETSYLGPSSAGDKQFKTSSSSSSMQRQRMAAYAMQSSTLSKTKKSLVTEDDLDIWTRPPAEASGIEYYVWLAKIPVNFVLFHTVPDCTLYPDKYYLTFIISITWTALFSYVMVWMVCLIGYTLGIPDSIMGITFLAAGTSVPDAYSSIHVAKMGMADMAVSNSIGSNIFDILVGLSLPWFIQTAIYPGTFQINSNFTNFRAPSRSHLTGDLNSIELLQVLPTLH